MRVCYIFFLFTWWVVAFPSYCHLLWHWYKNFSQECNKIDLALSFVVYVCVYALIFGAMADARCSVSFVLFSNFTQFFVVVCAETSSAAVIEAAVEPSLYRFFVDCLMKRKNPHVIQYACCRRFIKIRKLYREIFSMSHHEYRSHSRSNRQCDPVERRKKKNM